MRDIASHILDIAGNSIRAKASLVKITVEEMMNDDLFNLSIEDNGEGMDKKTLQQAIDPFFTSRKTRKVGLGIPLLKQNAEAADGELQIYSEPGVGTSLKARFIHSHMDRVPLGDIPMVISLLVSGNVNVDFVYKHSYNGEEMVFDSRQVKNVLDGVEVNHPKVVKYIKQMVEENLQDIGVEL